MCRGFGGLISAVVIFSVESARVNQEVAEELRQPQWIFNGLTIGSLTEGALVPELVPPPNTTYEIVNREMESGPGIDHNRYYAGEVADNSNNPISNYQWALLNVNQSGHEIQVNQWFAEISGDGFYGGVPGTRRTVVRDNNYQDVFIIESRRGTDAWFIRDAYTNHIMFEVRKDFFGAGFLGSRDEWRIYRGEERDRNQIYYIVADYSSRSHEFYHNEDEFQNSTTACAQTRFYTPGGIYSTGLVSDSIGVSVGPGEDTALILSTTIVIDIANEDRAASERHASVQAGLHGESDVDRAGRLWNHRGRPGELVQETLIGALSGALINHVR